MKNKEAEERRRKMEMEELRVGDKFQAAPDADTPGIQYEVVEDGLWVDVKEGTPVEAGTAGSVHAVRLQFADGTTEIAAVACVLDALSCGVTKTN